MLVHTDPKHGSVWYPATRGNEESNVNDRSVSLGCVAAYAMWVTTVGLLLMGTVHGSGIVAMWGLAMSAGAATATIRSYFVNHNRMMRNAFDLGRDSAGVTVPPTRLRSEP